ncbi:glycosyltransferase WbsX family protein [Ectobacillus panaciterrae]|uniref:glycosyltransferase WbsX family protein n=1 Tax=Ectobacillus panaciterrae TaxID=363872 RepID=UPI0003FDF568|nr:glycoside hydrolase family 99-like domain-containing protein [Ectobacillus panaciterrae]
MKIIAFYLPQFHRIPENDQWWGEGFTEWTNTRRAQPLFHRHYQPREPLNNYYYNLTDPTTRRWQAEIAKKYGIYGFCYYHYWFKGKQLLERPFNEVLRLGEPDFPFCLSWANESWTRTWDGGNNDILIGQEYGHREDWKKHFDYLLKAFLDNRYIRINNKPVFLIYRPELIQHCEEMLNFWNDLAKEAGLDGIYFIRTLNGFPYVEKNGFDASVEFEPMYTLRHDYLPNPHILDSPYRPMFADYDATWDRIVSRVPQDKNNNPIIPGAFVDWDNTARLKKNALIYRGATPEKFGKYLSVRIQRAKSIYNSNYLFINAWNEWAEGTYLEPDKRYGFRYLEEVKKAVEENS